MTPIQLWTKNRPLARTIAQDFFLPGSERKDVQQEAMIALWDAATKFQESEGCPFKVFARTVVKNHLMDCVTKATRNKQVVLNDSSRDEIALHSVPHLHQVSDLCEERGDIKRLLKAISDLNAWERHCVVGIASGLSYGEIGDDFKRIDNTLYRARAKLREAMR